MVLISGEPGIGKSRLTAVLSEHIESEPHTRLRYFCAPHHQHSVLYPFIAQLERAAGFTRDDTVDGQLLLSLDDHLAAAGALNRRRLALHTQLQMGRETRKEAAGCVCRRCAGRAAARDSVGRARVPWPVLSGPATMLVPSQMGGGDEKALQGRRQTGKGSTPFGVEAQRPKRPQSRAPSRFSSCRSRNGGREAHPRAA